MVAKCEGGRLVEAGDLDRYRSRWGWPYWIYWICFIPFMHRWTLSALEVPLPWRIVPWLRDGLSLQLLRNLCRISHRGTEVLSFLETTTLALTEAGLFLARSGINRWKNRNYLSFHGWNGRKKYQPSRNPWRCFANGILQFLRIDDYE
jgi:hypothetical protein